MTAGADCYVLSCMSVGRSHISSQCSSRKCYFASLQTAAGTSSWWVA